MNKIKKEGLIDDYILQLHWGCAIGQFNWGSYAIYCPETDELLHWDRPADKELGAILLEKGDDFWNLNIQCGVAPSRLPEGSKACEGCVYQYSCWSGGTAKMALAGITERPEIAGLVAKFAEVKGMSSEVDGAAEELRDQIIEAINETPGTYRSGNFEFTFGVRVQKRFNGDRLKKSDPVLYESFRDETTMKILSKPKEV